MADEKIKKDTKKQTDKKPSKTKKPEIKKQTPVKKKTTPKKKPTTKQKTEPQKKTDKKPVKKEVKKPETKKPTTKKTEIKKQTKEKKKSDKPPKKEEEKDKIKKPKIKKKKKPKITDSLKSDLEKRSMIKKRTPEFKREEWFRYKRIPQNWRRPDGLHSKMRKHLKYRPSVVRVGFRGPKTTRGLHPSGFEEVMVYNIDDLEKIDPNKQAGRIGGSVGTKKRIDIEKRAEELDIRILNKQYER